LPSTINQPLLNHWWRALATTVATLATFATVAKFSPEIHRLREHDERVTSLAAEERRLELVLTAADQKHRWLREEPAYVDATARDRLDLRRPEETIYRITPAEKAP